MAAGGTAHILQSLAVNAAIAAGKGVAAFLTGSGALLAETLHSFADCGNQALLLLGVNRSRRPPDEIHPLGYGRSLYFWSFIVALLLFSGGGVFSIYEGIHKLAQPQALGRIGLGVGILVFSLLLEGWAIVGNIREMNRRRGQTPFLSYLHETKDSDLVVVFGENSAAVTGLTFALVALLVSAATGDARWDAAGSLAIGVVLVGVAIFLAVEVKSLLLGESADPAIEAAVRELARDVPGLDHVLHIITIQEGPGAVMLALKARFAPNLSTDELSRRINRFEQAIKARRPDVRWCFVEPDLSD